MLKKTVTYEDFNGEMQTEDHYFHLSKNQLIELEMSHQGGLSKILPELVKSQDLATIMDLFRKMIKMCHGTRSEDGRRFTLDTPAEAEEFINSPAFDALFADLTSTPQAAEEFITGIVPKDLMKAADNSQQVTPVTKPWMTENREPTEKELRAMSHEDMLEAWKARSRRQASQ